MDWIPNILRIWIFSFGIGLGIFALLINEAVQQQTSKWVGKYRLRLITNIVVSLVIFVVIGFSLAGVSGNYEDRLELETKTHNLITEITQFVADRALTQPMATDIWESPDVWFQKSREYSANTDNLFVARYRQRISDIAYEMERLNTITEDELEQLLWFIQPEYPSIQWAFETLEEYSARLE